MLHSFHWSTQLTTGWPCHTAFTGPLSSPFGGHVTQLSLVHSAHHWVAMLHSFHWSTQLTTGWPCYTAFTGPLSSPLGGHVAQLSRSTQLTTGWPCYTAFTGPLSSPFGGHVTQLSLVHSAHYWVAMLHSFHWSTQLTTGWPCYTAFDFLNFVLVFLIKCSISYICYLYEQHRSLVHSAYHWVAMLHSFSRSTQLTTGWPCYTAFTGPLSSPLDSCVTQLSLVHSAHYWVAMLHSFHWSTQLTTG